MISNDQSKVSEPQLSVNSLIAEIKWKPPQTLEEKNEKLNRLLATCPKSKGGGIHQWLWIVAYFLHRYPFLLIPETILECLREATRDCKRKVTEQELLDAVNNSSQDKTANLLPSGNGSGSSKSLFSRRGDLSIKVLDAAGINLQGLINCDSRIFSPQYTLSLLYPDKPLCCFAYVMDRTEGVIATTWDDPLLRPFPPLMVPNPLLGKWALTANQKPSPRAKANIGKRKYLVLDFDDNSKDDHAVIIWHLRQQWKRKHVPLIMVMDSGKRSLHAWFKVQHLEEPEIYQLCRQAYQLGACDSTFGKQQLVRVPGAIRLETGKLQRVYYFNEQRMKG